MTLRWRAACPADLLWVEWGDRCAVFHRPSGKTHFVNGATAYLLRDLLDVPRDADEIRSGLGLVAEGDAAAMPPDEIEQLLPHLESLGLVSREP